MKYALDDIIKFDNEDYLVLDVINYSGSTFLYLINNSEFKDDISIVKVGENGSLEYINDEKEFDYVMNRIFMDNESDLYYLVTKENN